MSTRCQVAIKDHSGELWFYRHSDGYPEGVAKTLDKFCQLIRDNRIRKSLLQSSGWLVILGAIEYQTVDASVFPQSAKRLSERDGAAVDAAICAFSPSNWKAGAYEPCEKSLHGDIDFFYVVDLETSTWKSVGFNPLTNTHE